MKKNFTELFKIIKSDKKTKIFVIFTILILFVFVIGFSLSFISKSKLNLAANININNLLYNITTNSGTSNDRILHLKAGKEEKFDVIITSLNNISTKYELIYDICSNSNCTSTLSSLPSNVSIQYSIEESDDITGIIDGNNGTKKIILLTYNNTTSDVYIRLNLKVGYVWNDLSLSNQISEFIKNTNVEVYVDGTKVTEYPNSCFYNTEITGYKNNSVVALKDASLSCNESNNEWKVTYIGDTVNKIKISFNSNFVKFREYLLNLDETENGIELDTTPDTNFRFTGATPNNYLSFNGEVWRIIGIFNVFNAETNENENLIKIIRNDSLGKYSWDSSASTVNSGYGVNEWSQADLMYELNCDSSEDSIYCRTDDITKGYLSNLTTGETNWYGSKNTKAVAYDFSNNIKSTSINKIATVRWNTGLVTSIASPLNSYNLERGDGVLANPSDKVERYTTWDGKIGLMYPSDYGYASTNTSCRSGLSTTNCKTNNWLFTSSYGQWTLSPYSGYLFRSFNVKTDGSVNHLAVYNTVGVRPALYLKSDVMLAGGNGTSDNPYVLS